MQFGTYTFPVGWGCTNDSDTQTLFLQPTPRRDGASSLPPQRGIREWTLTGGFLRGELGCADTATGVRDSLDALRAALIGQGPSNFFIDGDRYWQNVAPDGVPLSEEMYHGRYASVTFKLRGPDPFAYATANTTSGELVAAGYTYTNAVGNAYALPVFYFRLDEPLNTAFSWLWTDSGNGREFSLAGAWPGSGAGYLIVDSALRRVRFAPELGGLPPPGPGAADLGNAVDAMAYFEGQFLMLPAGVSSWAHTWTTAPPSGVWLQYTGRWL
jgi:hypothetical protein